MSSFVSTNCEDLSESSVLSQSITETREEKPSSQGESDHPVTYMTRICRDCPQSFKIPLSHTGSTPKEVKVEVPCGHVKKVKISSHTPTILNFLNYDFDWVFHKGTPTPRHFNVEIDYVFPDKRYAMGCVNFLVGCLRLENLMFYGLIILPFLVLSCAFLEEFQFIEKEPLFPKCRDDETFSAFSSSCLSNQELIEEFRFLAEMSMSESFKDSLFFKKNRHIFSKDLLQGFSKEYICPHGCELRFDSPTCYKPENLVECPVRNEFLLEIAKLAQKLYKITKHVHEIDLKLKLKEERNNPRIPI